MRLRWLLPILLLPVLVGIFLSQVSFRSGEKASGVAENSTVSTKGSGHDAKTVAARNQTKQVPAPLAEKPVTRTVPLAPSPLDRPTAEELVRFPGAKVLDGTEVAGPGPGQVTRVRILETDFKYPHLRTEEIIDETTGQVLSREEMVADHVLVTLQQGEDPAALLANLNLTEATMEAVSPDPAVPLFRLQLPSASLEAVPSALAALDKTTGGVVSAEPDFIRQGLLVPNDPKYLDGTLWGLNQANDVDIDAPEAWDIRSAATGITVAVIDTGIRYTHQDLTANAWTNPGEIAGDRIDNDANGYVDDVRGIDAYNRDGDPMDDQGHGTHCAGTIGATGNNGIGLTGVAWGVRLMALKFLSSTGSGSDSDAVICIDYARLKGAKILSCSWGGGGAGTSLQAAIERARTAGILMVAAAGNETNNNDLNPSYPASYPHDNIISVASTTSTDALSSFSNYGATSVDLGAPGSSIYSTVSTSDTAYATYSGTSMATPHVSGALALLAAQYPTDTYTGLISRLLNGTDPIAALTGKARAGRLNLAKALVSTNAPPVVRPANDNFASASGVTGTSWTRTGSSVNATAETGEPSHAGQAPGFSIWYSWTAPASGAATLSTAGSNFDTVLAVYTGSTVGALTPVAANDNPAAGGTTAAVSFQAVAGATYRIAVDGKGGTSGSVTLAGNLAGATVANDAFASATVVSNSFTVTGSNVGATREALEPNHGGVSGAKSAWWSWTAPASGRLVVATAGSSYDTVLAVYTGSRVDQLRQVAANDDVSRSDMTSRVTISVRAGTTYRIAVDGYQGAAGSIRLAGTFTAKTALAAPSNVNGSLNSSGIFRASWTPVAGAAMYEVTVRSATRTYAIVRTPTASVALRMRIPATEAAVVTVRAFDVDMDPGLPSTDRPVTRTR
jgi:subtilisin family serine protease